MAAHTYDILCFYSNHMLCSNLYVSMVLYRDLIIIFQMTPACKSLKNYYILDLNLFC